MAWFCGSEASKELTGYSTVRLVCSEASKRLDAVKSVNECMVDVRPVNEWLYG